jgi:homoserine kinase
MIRVRIPATTANLGPGFDCMGLALDLWNSFELVLRQGDGIEVVTYGEGAESLPKDATHLVASTMMDELTHMGISVPTRARITCHNTIPPASGLGSSSSAILAGLMFAQAVARHTKGHDPSDFDRNEVLARAVELEGHGDNVAPALLGGFVIVVPDARGVLTQRVPHVPMKTVVCVPEFQYFTTDARAALPDSYSKSDAIFNIGRAMLVAEALRFGDDDLLKWAMNDRIHEPYRLPAIPGSEIAKESALQAGALCVALSGAGPGMIAFAREKFDRIGQAMKSAFASANLPSRYWVLDATDQGAHIERLPV